MILRHDSVEVLISSRETGGRFTVCRLRTQMGEGLPQHEHSYEDGFFFVLEGEYRFEIGGKPVTTAAGASVFIPRGTAHAFAQVSAGPAAVLIVSLPGGFDLFLQDMRAIGQPGAPGVWTTLAPLLEKHGIRLVGAPDAGGGV